VAGADTPVLLLGETGTGKELLAQSIHELSARRERPMVIVNCASLPATLIESELFGREAGAYTGAASAQVGRFEIADGSTLFLDEIGEFPIELQAKLLRVLQDGRFERLGSPESVTVNVRIIAATNRDLEQAMRDGKFRADLYHRLNVFPIHVPPLRERREDIPLLVWAFVEIFGHRMGKTTSSIPRRTMDQLQQYSWPGNVRELSNVIERAMILSTGDSLLVEMPTLAPGGRRSPMTLIEGMREQILRVLQDTGWRIRGAGGAAEILAVIGLFGGAAAWTGVNEKTLKRRGDTDYEKIYLFPNSHAGYYPGAEMIGLKVIFRKSDGKLLGAQALGKDGPAVDKRISALAAYLQMGATIYDLEEAELCYAPQFGSAKDPVNFAGMALLESTPRANLYSVAIGMGALLIVRLFKRHAPKIPGALVALILLTTIVAVFNLQEKGVSVLGSIPSGPPSLSLPVVPAADYLRLLPGAMAIVAITLCEGLLLVRQYSRKHGYKADGDQVLFA